MAARGDGGRATAEFVPFGRLLTYRFLIMAMTSIPSDGWRLGRAIHFSRGGAEPDLVLVSSGSAISIASGISIDSATAMISTGAFRMELNRCADASTNASRICVKRNAIHACCAA